MAESSWTTVGVGLPEQVTAVVAPVTSVVGALLDLLRLTSDVLDVIRGFFLGALDPLEALVAQLIIEINQAISDFRQLGIYVAGDFDPVWPFVELSGGYQSYEQRMVRRLVDRSDPTRPAFTPSSKVAAVFLYQSFSTSEPEAALRFVDQVRTFFGLPGTTISYPPPAGLTVTYGVAGARPGSFKPTGSGTSALVQWTLSAPPGASASSWPLPRPPAFLVEVSTVKSGLKVGYRRPSPSVDGSTVFGLVTDPSGNPFKLYGGRSVIDVEDLAWTEGPDGSHSPPSGDGSTSLLAYRSDSDPSPIPVSALYTGGVHVFQKAFLVTPRKGGPMSPGDLTFTTILTTDDMPHDALVEYQVDGTVVVTPAQEPASNVYVRVSSLSEAVLEASAPLASAFYWTIGSSGVSADVVGQARLSVSPGMTAYTKSKASEVLPISFSTGTSDALLMDVATALLVAVLSRSDLTALGAGSSFRFGCAAQPTGLEAVFSTVAAMVLGPNPGDLFKRTSQSPVTGRGRVQDLCMRAASQLLSRVGVLPTSVQAYVSSSSLVTTMSGDQKRLSEVTWADLVGPGGSGETLMSSMDPTTTAGSDPTSGVFLNPLLSASDPSLAQLTVGSEADPLPRRPGFSVEVLLTSDVLGSRALVGSGSADYSPVYRGAGGVEFCRNVFLRYPSLFSASTNLLSFTSAPYAPGSGSWYAYRLFPQGIRGVDAALGEAQAFLSSVADSTSSASSAVEGYVAGLQARVNALESLLRRIDAMLSLTANLDVPFASGLVVVADGTDGVVNALVSASNKPTDDEAAVSSIGSDGSPTSGGTYGAGVVLLSGSPSSTLIDLLLSFFPKED